MFIVRSYAMLVVYSSGSSPTPSEKRESAEQASACFASVEKGDLDVTEFVSACEVLKNCSLS